jgi:hypothetical protein
VTKFPFLAERTLLSLLSALALMSLSVLEQLD